MHLRRPALKKGGVKIAYAASQKTYFRIIHIMLNIGLFSRSCSIK